MKQKRVVILGGGISGLAAAWRLARKAPKNQLKITLIESSSRVGGWLKSTIVPGVTTFESGPRSLRPTGIPGLATLELVDQLGLTDKMYPVDKKEPASKIRAIFSHGALHQLPTSLMGMLTSKSPILKGLILGLLKEPFVSSRLGVEEDESVHDFVSRRLGSRLALNLVSGLVHGIYAGDSSKLSVKATLKILYELEKESGSLVRGILSRARSPEDPQLETLRKKLAERNPKLSQVYSNASMYSFDGGIEQLSISLEKELLKLPNVEIVLDSPATKLEFKETVKVHINGQSQSRVLEADHVIGAIPGPVLQKLIEKPIGELTYNPSVDVAVVSMAFDKKVLPYAAFGYLVPRSVTDSIALGVVFDSCSFPLASPSHEVLTVMMGGHQFPQKIGDPMKVSNEELLDMARRVLKKQLGIQEAPAAHQVTLQHQCIPQYLVGHPQRMHNLHKTLLLKYNSKLSVTGASYTGVAINDCVLYSAQLADQLLTDGVLGSNLSPTPVTGLELYKTMT